MASQTVVILASMEALPGRADEMRAALCEASIASNEEDGCLFYQLLEDVSKPETFLVVEKWRDRDAFKAHQAADHLAKTAQTLKPLLAGPPEFAPWRAID